MVLKILIEGAARRAGDGFVRPEDLSAYLAWRPGAAAAATGEERELPFSPARVVLQDFTGVPAVVDLAALRAANPALITVSITPFGSEGPKAGWLGGDLTLADLYNLSMNADLVTLSGCGTGLSAVVGGDELVGLMRGLLHAGARSVLLTMWQVDDYSTAEFMGRFYRLLGEGRNRADAVADAMRAVRSRFPHPYYWAPFVLIGQSSGPYISRKAAVPMETKGSAGGSRRPA